MQAAQVLPFHFDTREVRTLLIDDQPWFVAADVSAALEYRIASDMTRNLDDDEKGTQIVRTPGGDQEMLVINESGLYSAILRSRKAEAKRFKKWVTAEVLPAIRKHGRYEGQTQQPLARPEDVAQMMSHQRFLVTYNDGQLTSIVPVGSEACVIDPNNEVSVLTFFREFLPSETKLKVTELGFRQLATLAGKQIASWK